MQNTDFLSMACKIIKHEAKTTHSLRVFADKSAYNRVPHNFLLNLYEIIKKILWLHGTH